MDDIVKGYEYEKDQYVVLSPEDFRRANVKASQTVHIKAFVPAREVPLQYFETPYYLAPGKRGEKVYALLRETLKATGRIAIFTDTYQDDLMQRIEEKIQRGETSVITKEEGDSTAPQSAQVIDLTELLRASLSGKKASNDSSAAAPRRAAKETKPATRTKVVAEPAAKKVAAKRNRA